MISMDHIDVYRDAAGDWRWSYRSSNGRTMCDSAEGYKRKAACLRAAQHVLNENQLPEFPPVRVRDE